MALPAPAQELCFSTETFIDADFNVDEFLSQCRKRVTIECLREDLDSYFRTLKSAMVELINKDYADFVNLSSNLVGMDKAIDNLTSPLGQLREEIMSIKLAMETAIAAAGSKLARRAEIREEKATLQRLAAILESVEKLERLLKIGRTPTDGEASEIDQLAEREEFAAVVMERIATEFNKLQYNVSLTSDHPLVEETKPRIATITSTLQSHLEDSFRTSLEHGDREGLSRSLQTYTTISRQQAAEGMFQNLIVHPYMEKVVSTKAVLTHPQGLPGLYSEVLRFVPKHCPLLLEITQAWGGREHGVQGFDFIVNAVWPEVVRTIDEKAAILFAPGNPDTFHKNYTASMEFVSSFEALCPSQSSVKRLRSHPSFTSFMSKWSLPIYFQIRFQEIAGALEGSLSDPFANAQSSKEGPDREVPPFKLELFQVLWSSLQQCWKEGTFLPALVHRFWKLTLQLIIRTAACLKDFPTPTAVQPGGVSKSSPSATAEDPTLTVAQCMCVIHDSEELSQQIPKLYREVIKPKFPNGAAKSWDILEDGLKEAKDSVLQLIPDYATCVIKKVSQECVTNLEPAHTIPRLYRRTNKEVPRQPSSYVNNVLKPLESLRGNLPQQYKQEWIHRIVQTITDRYFEITSEVLTSVKRTEDSLMKLKKNRKSLVPVSSSGMSDDNKIRLQLALDIQEYTAKVSALQLDRNAMPSLANLIEMGQTARTVALSVPL